MSNNQLMLAVLFSSSCLILVQVIGYCLAYVIM